MAKILTKYSQAQDITVISAPSGLVTVRPADTRTPYSFSEWVERNVGIIPGQEKRQYDEYLNKWYREHNIVTDEVSQRLKQDYENLLRQITLVFQDEAEQIWATDVDFDDPLEVEQVLPFYVRKLKEIAIYYINKRDAIRRAKLKYNTVGTRLALESLFYEYLLKAFTKRRFPGNEYITNVTDLSVLNALPELSAVANSFQITIEELYDDTSYFDKQPTFPATTYFDLCATTVVDYLTGKGFTPAEFDWLYSTGFAHLCADNPLLWSLADILAQYDSGVPVSALECCESTVLNEYNKFNLTKKYLGETQYILTGGYYNLWVADVEFPFQGGNNWFYWASGEYFYEAGTTRQYLPLYLVDSTLLESGAVAGTSYRNSDLIFTFKDGVQQGAWLQRIDYATVTPTMCARLIPGKNIFSYPFPGYGVSGEDLPWTGRQFSNVEYEFEYLDSEIQDDIRRLYWGTTTNPISALDPVYIAQATLIDAGALAGTKYDESDTITIREGGLRDVTPNTVYTGVQKYAWLYKMNKTDIPIATATNLIYWPFVRYTQSIPAVALTSQCIPMALSSLDMKYFVGACAGTHPQFADTLFKYSTPDTTPIDGAWLSGAPLATPSGITGYTLVSSARQPSLAVTVEGGSNVPFIWSDIETPADDVIQHIKHQPDCAYAMLSSIHSLYYERPEQKKPIDYDQWKQCECKALFYSPLGHPGATYDEYDGMADFIAATTQPVSSFDFSSWRGLDGKNYTQSDDFGWWQLTEPGLEPDVGWSGGHWITNTGSQFKLKQNTLYAYYRNGLRRNNAYEHTAYIVIRYPYITQPQKWIKMSYNPTTKRWVSDNTTSTMVFKPGDYLSYTHKNTNTITLTSVRIDVKQQTITIPPDFTQATAVVQGQTYYSTMSSIQVSGITIEYPVVTNGAPITAVASVLNAEDTTTTTTSSVSTTLYTTTRLIAGCVNYMLNVPLSGWNYTTSEFDGIAAGGRPFWADATDTPMRANKYKGISVWDRRVVPVDAYNFITQPDFSTATFTSDSYLEYDNAGESTIVWIQPLTYLVSETTQAWKKLLFDTSSIFPLSSQLNNNLTDLVVTATNLSSDIVFESTNDSPMLVNYYARASFVWTQSLIDVSEGVPPTGGYWTPIVSGVLVEPLSPYAYLTNRHYPTYATAPYVGELYTTKDSGGYMIPRMLGVTTAVGKNYTTILDTIDIIPQYEKDRGTTRIYQEPHIYTSDQGLTRTDQLVPVSTTYIDSTWMKASITQWYKAGSIVGALDHQEFIPYQTKFETLKYSTNGIRYQNDEYDPWNGSLDNTWSNPIDWPPNYREQYLIDEWYEQFFTGEKQIYQWKTDIFGNQYALYKNLRGLSIYDRRQALGEMWTRDNRNVIKPGAESLDEIYINFVAINSALSGDLTNKIRNFEIWYDTIMFETTGYLLFARINFDYNTNRIYAIADNIHFIPFCTAIFGGTWFFEEDKNVVICMVDETDEGSYYPILYGLDLETNVLRTLYTAASNVKTLATSSLALSSIETPVFTYNKDTKRYNVSFIGNSQQREGMYLVSIDITAYGNVYDIVSVTGIIPTV